MTALRKRARAASPAESRNTRLRRELAAEYEAELERELAMPAAKREALERLAEALGQPTDPEERHVQVTAMRMLDASLACEGCHRDFQIGDVIHRKRHWRQMSGELSWRLHSYCEGCVKGWHPSWFENRQEPVECPGGCGALVSEWLRYEPHARVACSRRCAERAIRERRRVKHDERDCERCGASFVPRRSPARFCSNACRQAAHRARRAA